MLVCTKLCQNYIEVLPVLKRSVGNIVEYQQDIQVTDISSD